MNLYPTRIPYEESSVFSQVDVLHPDLRRFPAFQGARAHTVTLQPGQVGEKKHTRANLLMPPRHQQVAAGILGLIVQSLHVWTEMLTAARRLF